MYKRQTDGASHGDNVIIGMRREYDHAFGTVSYTHLDVYKRQGNMLGAEQSGFIADLGYETYQKILSEAVHELGEAEGITMIIGNMFIGGCSLERHVQNIRNNAPAYAKSQKYNHTHRPPDHQPCLHNE